MYTVYAVPAAHPAYAFNAVYTAHTLQSLPAGFLWLPAASMAVLYLIMTYMKGVACRQHKLMVQAA